MRFVNAGACGEENFTSSANVVRVHFEGVERTKASALQTETKNLFKAKTFQDLIIGAFDTKLQMQRDGLFENIVVLVDVDRSDQPANDGYEVTFVAQEPKRCRANLSAGFSNRGEGSVTSNLMGYSVFGAGEAASVSVSKGNESSTSFHVGFVKPLLKWRNARVGVNLFRNFADFPWSGFVQTENGLSLEFRHQPFKHITHQIFYKSSWRRVDVVNRAAFAVREHAGHSLKSSVVNVNTYDTQDDPVVATKGILAKHSIEIAGLGGDAKFTRNELDLKLSTTLPLGVILALGGQLSYVQARSGRTLNIVDRTFLGGAVNLRGFSYNGIGAVNDDCYLGGMAAWSGAVHLYRRLFPSFLFAHTFATVGNIHDVASDRRAADVLRQLSVTPRFSLGAGILVKIGQMGRLELNYCFPFTSHVGDRLHSGFQFGVGVNFV